MVLLVTAAVPHAATASRFTVVEIVHADSLARHKVRLGSVHVERRWRRVPWRIVLKKSAPTDR